MRIKLKSISPSMNRFRYYEIEDELQSDLFTPYTLTIRSGRIGTKGLTRHLVFDTKEEKTKKLNEILNKRRKNGYTVDLQVIK